MNEGLEGLTGGPLVSHRSSASLRRRQRPDVDGAPFNLVTRARSGWYARANSAAREVGGELVDGLGGVGREAVEDAGPALGQPWEAGEP